MHIDIMLYCPNCSAPLEDPNVPICSRCGFDRIDAMEDEEARRQEELVRRAALMAGESEPVQPVETESGMKCPECSAELTPSMINSLSFELMGRDVSIHNVRIMGMNLHKRAVTQCIVNFEGYECNNKHKYFVRFSASYKELCPICRDPMKKFGSQIRTCLRCKENIPGDDYLRLDARDLLEDEGWVYKPELA
jgi:hypothetical protein